MDINYSLGAEPTTQLNIHHTITWALTVGNWVLGASAVDNKYDYLH